MSSANAPSSGTSARVADLLGDSTIDWPLVRRQLTGILRMELRSTLLSKRMLAVLFLAFAPVGLVSVWALTPLPREMADGPMAVVPLFAVFFVPYVGISVFLSCLIVFMTMFRSEIQEKTLHYYYLSPVRREVVVAAKYLAGLVGVVGVYVVSTTFFYLMMVLPWGVGELSRHLVRGPGLSNLTTYVGLSVLSCIGFGAVFLLAGLLIRNPVIVAILVWVWEILGPFLPALLKKLTIGHYLRSMYPIPVQPKGIFAFLATFAEPTPAYLAVPGLVLVSLVFVALASWRLRTMEIKYGGED